MKKKSLGKIIYNCLVVILIADVVVACIYYGIYYGHKKESDNEYSTLQNYVTRVSSDGQSGDRYSNKQENTKGNLKKDDSRNHKNTNKDKSSATLEKNSKEKNESLTKRNESSLKSTDSNSSKSSKTALSDVKANNNINWKKVKKANRDIYSWLDVTGTNINYPILQSDKAGDYYLHHNLDGSYGFPGCIYSEKPASKNFDDYVTVLYGHNMRDNSMFGSLHAFEYNEYIKKHKRIYIYTEQKTISYEILLAVNYKGYNITKATSFDSGEEVNSFLKTIRKTKGCLTSKDFSYTDNPRLLILSTCTSKDKSKRFIVVARRL